MFGHIKQEFHLEKVKGLIAVTDNVLSNLASKMAYLPLMEMAIPIKFYIRLENFANSQEMKYGTK